MLDSTVGLLDYIFSRPDLKHQGELEREILKLTFNEINRDIDSVFNLSCKLGDSDKRVKGEKK